MFDFFKKIPNVIDYDNRNFVYWVSIGYRNIVFLNAISAIKTKGILRYFKRAEGTLRLEKKLILIEFQVIAIF